LKNLKSKLIKNKFSLFFLFFSTLFIIYVVHNNKAKEEVLNTAIKIVKEKLPNFKYSQKSCFVLNGCVLKNVSFDLLDKKIKTKSLIVSNKILEIFSKNFKDDKSAGVVFFNDIDIIEKKNENIPEIPKGRKSASAVLSMGKIDDKNILILELNFNKGIIASLDKNKTIFKIILSGETDKNVSFKSWDSIPEIKENKIFLNKKLLKEN